jgi:N-acetylglucosaminyl-diphospho-decaprenol L-rhamnosyltransferase
MNAETDVVPGESGAGDLAWTAVVVNFDSGPLLASCVRSLLADDSAGRCEVVVVDNASADDSSASVSAVPGVRVVAAGANVGYARAANRGIAVSRTPIVAVLNPDTVTAPGSAAAVLARFAAEPDIAAVGPRIDNPDGTPYPGARGFPSLIDAIGHGLLFFWWRDNPFSRRYRQSGADPDVARDVDWVSGSAIWLRRAALDAVGGWDERYFMYMEDVDLAWRLGRAGWRVVYEPGARIVHVGGTATSRRPYRMLVEHHRSMWLFTRVSTVGVKRITLPLLGMGIAARGALAIVHRWSQGLGDRREPSGARSGASNPTN